MTEPASTTPTELPQKAVHGFLCRIDGNKRFISRNQVVQPDDPVLKDHAEHFVSVTATPQETQAARVSISGKITCVQCRGRAYKAEAVQRMFCSESCFKERRKRLSRTLKDASKRKAPTRIEDIEQALADVQALQLAWKGQEEPTIERPSPKARAIVMGHRSRLVKALNQAKREAREASEERARKAAADRYREAQEDARKRQADAEKELITAAGNIHNTE